MRKESMRCANVRCNASSTPMWRKGWKLSDGTSVNLCNACGIHYRKGHFCSLCFGIYKEGEADDPQRPWVGCDKCGRWLHKTCVAEKMGKEEITCEELFLCNLCIEDEAIAKSAASQVDSSLPVASSVPALKPRQNIKPFAPNTRCIADASLSPAVRRKPSGEKVAVYTPAPYNPRFPSAATILKQERAKAAAASSSYTPSRSKRSYAESKHSYAVQDSSSDSEARVDLYKNRMKHSAKKTRPSPFEFASETNKKEEEVIIDAELQDQLDSIMSNSVYRRVPELQRLGTLFAVCEYELINTPSSAVAPSFPDSDSDSGSINFTPASASSMSSAMSTPQSFKLTPRSLQLHESSVDKLGYVSDVERIC